MKRFKWFGILPVLMSLLLCTPSAFADNPYGIIYNGGVNLGEDNNIQANPDLIDSLSPVVTGEEDFKITYSNHGIWQKGWHKNREDGPCVEAMYIKASDFANARNEVYYTMSQGKYSAKVIIKNIVVDGTVNAEAGSYAIMVRPDGGIIRFASWDLFTDNTCTTAVADVQNAVYSETNKYFIEMDLKLYTESKGVTKIANSDQLYFNIWDFDNGQSCQIRNKVNGVDVLSAEKMYARDLINVQPTEENIESGEFTDLRNKYVVTSGGGYNYLYSQFDPETGKSFNINPDLGGNIYVKIDSAVQQEGIDLVFGFVHGGVSTAVRYYAKQYKVTYVSDEFGVITGLTKEEVMSGDSPSGSTQKPNDGYEFTHWVADTDVTLDDGTVIKKGEKMTNEQVLSVIVNHDVEFTAIHVPEPKEEAEVAVPDTGGAMGDIGTVIQVLCIAFPTLLIAGTFAKVCYDRKKHLVDFGK